MLAVSALKMNYTELGGSNNDFIYEMHGPKLFKQVKALKVPFHKWYDWLNEKFQNLKQMQDDLMLKKEQELQAWQEMQEEQKNQQQASKVSGIFERIYSSFGFNKPQETREEREARQLE